MSATCFITRRLPTAISSEAPAPTPPTSARRGPTWPVCSWISEGGGAGDANRCGSFDRSDASRRALSERRLLVTAFLAGVFDPRRAFFGRDAIGRTAFAAGRVDTGAALLDDDGLLLHRLADQPLGFFTHRLFRHP